MYNYYQIIPEVKMIDYTKRNKTAEASSVSYDEGLRQHMLKVYNYMFLGLGLTGLISLRKVI